MLVPAQQLPVSLIGSMWNFSSCWSAPEEEGYIEGKNVEVYYDISAMGIEGHKCNLKDIYCSDNVWFGERDLQKGTYTHTPTVQPVAHCLDNGATRPLCVVSQCNC